MREDAYSQSRLAGLARLKRQGSELRDADSRFAAVAGRMAVISSPDARARVVTSHNLFQTPESIASEMARLAIDGERQLGRTLEPSAGLGRLLRPASAIGWDSAVAVDVSADCCRELRLLGIPGLSVRQADFLSLPVEPGSVDTVLMNPPFRMGEDIRHILRAREWLAPGGRLVALCASGEKRLKTLGFLTSSWQELPAKSFASERTNVSVSLIVMEV